MSGPAYISRASLLAAMLLVSVQPARAQVTIHESGFSWNLLSNVSAKQVELGIGPDSCLYYGSDDGSFGNALYVADYAIGNIHRSAGCATSAPFASLAGPGAIAFPAAFGERACM